MKFKFNHNNINVLDLEKSQKFYQEALGLVEVKRNEQAEGEFILIFLGDGATTHSLELTWLRDRADAYNLGDNEFHIAFTVDNYEMAYKHHKQMDCICYENKEMGIYFISDPDGYWIEIIPTR
jgi:lactoylglutathione lyase